MEREEEKLSDEEIKKVYEVILRRVKRMFPENVDIKIVRYDNAVCSKTLGVKITVDGKVGRLHFISKNEDGRREYIMTHEKISKRSVVESLLKATAEHEVKLYGDAVLRRGETLESLLIEDDLFKEVEKKEERMKDSLEKDVLEKVNKLLKKHWREVGYLNEFYFIFSEESCEKVQITGNCIGRRFWRSLLEVVNAFAETFSFAGETFSFVEESSMLWQMYKPFKSLKSRSLEELAVKIDLVLREE